MRERGEIFYDPLSRKLKLEPDTLDKYVKPVKGFLVNEKAGRIGGLKLIGWERIGDEFVVEGLSDNMAQETRKEIDARKFEIAPADILPTSLCRNAWRKGKYSVHMMRFISLRNRKSI